MATRLSRLNGWQRLWLVASVCLALWLIVAWPVFEAGQQHDQSWDYYFAIRKDFDNPACRDYQVLPISTLREPGFGDGCWHIYTSRKYDASNTVPYTLAVYNHDRDAHWRQVYFVTLGIGAVGTVIASALVYLIGWLVAWIIGGFRRSTAP